MRSKDFSTGLRGALFEAKHYERMGAAIWLYGWLVLRETPAARASEAGWVLGGKPISYREIESETQFSPRTLERWMRILRDAGYIETRTVPGGVVVRITKAKKFSRAAAVRETAEPVRGIAEAPPQNCVRTGADGEDTHGDARRMGSGSIDKEKKDPPTGLEQNKNHERQFAHANHKEGAMAWRRLKEELVRRELLVGEGPRK
jgi:DNA-binding transcriptional ArsR family regulator